MSPSQANDQRPSTAATGPLPYISAKVESSPRSRKTATSPPPTAPPTYSYDPTQPPLQPLQPVQNGYQPNSYYPTQYATPFASSLAQYSAGSDPNARQTSPPSSTPTTATPTGENGKRSRLARACDQCSERKVKCDAFGPPCKPCKDLALPCTNNRETKRRGPRNRLAEEYHKSKRLKMDEGDHTLPPLSLSPAARRESAEALAYMSRRQDPLFEGARGSKAYESGYYQSPGLSYSPYDAGFNIDRLLCPKVILDLLVDDFFMYIHPVTPFPHEPSFRQAYRENYHVKDAQFLALLASMIGILVASFPRKPQEHLKAKNLQGEFATSLDFVHRCHRTATDARGPGYLDNNLTIYDGATSYFLGLSAAYTFEWRRARLYFSETLSIMRTLGVHRNFVPPISGVDGGGSSSVDYISQQIGRRLFWVMLAGIRSLQQLGTTFGELFVPPPTTTDPYPPLPEDIDDEYIFNDHIEVQPRGFVSRMAGFNINIKIYSALTKIATMEIAYGTDQVYDWPRQKQILNECYENVERALDYIPAELVLKPGSNVGEFASTIGNRPAVGYPDGRLNGVGMGGYSTGGMELSPRRKVQFEIQKANIYASQLGTRSYIVEKFWNLQEAFDKANSLPSSDLNSQGYTDGHTNTYPHAPGVRRRRLEDRVAQERENIVRDLLKVLCSISRVNMEPNGGSFVHKVRQITSTLIVTNDTRKGPVAHHAEEFLARLLDVLVTLERTGPLSPGIEGADGGKKKCLSEEEELRVWADLREVQLTFLAKGGFMATA